MMIEVTAKALKYRDLNGPEKIVLFQNINIASLLPKLPNSEKLHAIWQTFYSLYQVFQRENTFHVEIEEYEASIRLWVRDFTTVYQTRHVTPYLHAFAKHIFRIFEVAWKPWQIQSTRVREIE